MKRFILVLMMMTAGTGFLLAQDTLPMIDSIGPMILDHQHKPKSKKESLETIQAYFLQKAFLEPVLNDESFDVFKDDDDDSDPMMTMGIEFQKEIVAHQLAKSLAKRDVLGLKKHYMPEDNSAE